MENVKAYSDAVKTNIKTVKLSTYFVIALYLLFIGALHTPRQHQTRRPPMSPPTQTNIGFRTVRDPTIVGLLILITISLW